MPENLQRQMAWTCIKFNSYPLSTSLSIQLKHQNKAYLLFIFQVSVTFPNKLEGVKTVQGNMQRKEPKKQWAGIGPEDGRQDHQKDH